MESSAKVYDQAKTLTTFVRRAIRDRPEISMLELVEAVRSQPGYPNPDLDDRTRELLSIIWGICRSEPNLGHSKVLNAVAKRLGASNHHSLKAAEGSEGPSAVYTLEVVSSFGGPVLRFTSNGRWRVLSEDRSLKQGDYRTGYPGEIRSRSRARAAITIEGKEYKLDPTQFSLGEEVFFHSSSAFHRNYPPTPTRDDLKQVITIGDDSHHNVLVLRTSGRFELVDPWVEDPLHDPTVVVRHETFVAGNGYVGPRAARNRRFVEDHYLSSLEAWVAHLKHGGTQEYSDWVGNRSEAELLEDLKDLQARWGTRPT